MTESANRYSISKCHSDLNQMAEDPRVRGGDLHEILHEMPAEICRFMVLKNGVTAKFKLAENRKKARKINKKRSYKNL